MIYTKKSAARELFNKKCCNNKFLKKKLKKFIKDIIKKYILL